MHGLRGADNSPSHAFSKLLTAYRSPRALFNGHVRQGLCRRGGCPMVEVMPRTLYTLNAMSESFTDEMLKAVAAANDLLKRELRRAVAEGHSIHFMREGRIIERTREGDFELIQVGDAWVRATQAASETSGLTLTAYRGEVRDLERFAIEDEDTRCVWLCFTFDDAADYARSKVRQGCGSIGYVYTCQLKFAKVASIENEHDIFALSRSTLDSVKRLRIGSELLRADGFDGIYNDCDGSWGPEVAVLKSECASIVSRREV